MKAEVVLRYAWALWLVSWLVAGAWSARTVKRPARHRALAYRLLIMVGAILLFGLSSGAPSIVAPLWARAPIVDWAMVIVTLCGFLFTWWARITLGRLWSSGITQKADHRIVDAGPYGLVRHPIYSGLILAVVATAVVGGTAAAAAGAASIVVGLYIKARFEEGFLREQLGEETYRAYARRVPMLVPSRRTPSASGR